LVVAQKISSTQLSVGYTDILELSTKLSVQPILTVDAKCEPISVSTIATSRSEQEYFLPFETVNLVCLQENQFSGIWDFHFENISNKDNFGAKCDIYPTTGTNYDENKSYKGFLCSISHCQWIVEDSSVLLNLNEFDGNSFASISITLYSEGELPVDVSIICIAKVNFCEEDLEKTTFAGRYFITTDPFRRKTSKFKYSGGYFYGKKSSIHPAI